MRIYMNTKILAFIHLYPETGAVWNVIMMKVLGRKFEFLKGAFYYLDGKANNYNFLSVK